MQKPNPQDLAELRRFLQAFVDLVHGEMKPQLDPIQAFAWSAGADSIKRKISDPRNEEMLARVAEKAVVMIMTSPYMRRRLEELLDLGKTK